MRDVFLVTVFIEKLSFPIGYFSLEEALRIKRDMLDLYRRAGHATDVLITQFEKLPTEMQQDGWESVLEIQAAN